MDKIQREKEIVRKEIKASKKNYTEDQILYKSEEVMSVVEITGVFQEARTIFIYNALKDEVQTLDFIRKWENDKKFYLPVIVNNDLKFRHYTSSIGFEKNNVGIDEPIGENFTNYAKVDLIIVPGIAFDRKMNRMGRGRRFYDRFLPKLSAPRMGICFDFQLLDRIPSNVKDIKMDYIVSENDLLW